MTMYRKKPVQIEAVQFDGTPESGAAIMAWANHVGGTEEVEYHPFLADHFKGDDKTYVAHPDPYMRIKTLEGVMVASRGDWIIKGVKGEFYPCKPDIFEATYEAVDSPDGPCERCAEQGVAWDKGLWLCRRCHGGGRAADADDREGKGRGDDTDA